MKKLLIACSMVGLLAACGGNKQSKNTENAADTSAQVNTQSTNKEKPQVANADTPLSSEAVAKAKEYGSEEEVATEADKGKIIRYRSKSFIKEFPKTLLEAKNLQVLVLQSLRSASLPEEIKNFKKLTCLSLDGSKIEKLPEGIGELKNLKTVSLTSCRKLDIQQVLDVLKNCPKLENLSLSYIPFETMPATIGELKNLKHLRIKNNKFKTLPDEFYTLTNLEYLGISSTSDNPYNYEDIFKKLQKLPVLRTLFIPHANLKALPEVMKEYPALNMVVWRESNWKDAQAQSEQWSAKFPNFTVSLNTSSTPLYNMY